MTKYKRYIKYEVVKIDWQKVSKDELKLLDMKFDFFLLVKNGKLLYIGKSFKQHVKDEINHTLNREDLNISDKGLTKYVGKINLKKSTCAKRSRILVNNSECLLIFTHNSSENDLCKDNYTGRDYLMIKSSGCDNLIKKCVRVSKMKPYKSCI